ncbi:post-GPI attachment to proteins factor 4-like [Branchiostoma lanceolatum]|uniref:post-GPI attachment to proteins factor 4-like n=1 Tax=Branchiostoma lanceolatum TaxID=7740 RepID=UPI00345364DD
MSRRVSVPSILKLYTLVFCVSLPVLCHRLYFSIYYNQYLHMGGEDPSSYAGRFNDERRSQAQAFFASKTDGRSSKLTVETHTKVTLAIGVMTVNRRLKTKDGNIYNPGYLLQTVAAILQENTSFSTRVLICNVDSDPLSHSDAAFLSPFLSVRSKYQHANKPKPPDSSGHEKLKEDYTFCLNQTLALNSEYILIVEDDALALQGTFDIIDHIIRTKLEHKYHGFELMKINSTKAVIKLFSPQYHQRDFFTTKPKRIIINALELLGVGVVGGTAIIVLHFILVQKCTSTFALDKRFFFAAVVCSVLAALAVSRPHLLELRRVSKHLYLMIEANDCCTQAILYPKAAAMELKSYIHTSRRHDPTPLDGVLDEFVRERGYRQFAIEPNLFSHIGKYSSRHDSKLIYLQHFV